MDSVHRQAGPGAALRGGGVVIVDDDSSRAAVLESAFGRLGVRAVSFADGEEGWRGILERPDLLLVVANWMLPGLDGHRICRLLVERRPDVTTVLMVGRWCVAKAWSEMGLQADYVLAKPFPKAGVDAQVRLLIHLARGREGTSGPRSRHEVLERNTKSRPQPGAPTGAAPT